MKILLLVAFPVLGAIIGSFLGVVTTRLNTGRSIGGRSQCLSCRQSLRWYELIPIVSFLIQKGRCCVCHCRIPKKDFFIELISATAFFGVGVVYGLPALEESFLWLSVLFILVIISLLIIISLYDLEHMIVPDKIVLPFIVLSVLSLFVINPESSFFIQSTPSLPTWQHALAGVLAPLPFLLIWIISRGRLMGFGDIKMMVGMGFLLGLTFSVSAILYAFWIGAIVSIVFLIIQRVSRLFQSTNRFIMSSEIPFAPFLAIGTYLVLISQWNLFSIFFF